MNEFIDSDTSEFLDHVVPGTAHLHIRPHPSSPDRDLPALLDVIGCPSVEQIQEETVNAAMTGQGPAGNVN